MTPENRNTAKIVGFLLLALGFSSVIGGATMVLQGAAKLGVPLTMLGVLVFIGLIALCALVVNVVQTNRTNLWADFLAEKVKNSKNAEGDWHIVANPLPRSYYGFRTIQLSFFRLLRQPKSYCAGDRVFTSG